MRKVKPVFDTNETVATVAFWRTNEFPYIAGARINGVAGSNWLVGDGSGCVDDRQIIFALRLQDGLSLLEEVVRLRRKHDQAQANLTRIMGNHRRRSVVGRLDPQS